MGVVEDKYKTILEDLLKDPTLYKPNGVPVIDFKSKELDYPGTKYGLSQGPLLGKRISFDITNNQAEPTFKIGENYGRQSIDQFVRGGTKYAEEARDTDFLRIREFLYETPNGELFLQKQSILQALNPRPQKIYNYGVNTLASVAAAGVSNVRRGGLLPSVGDFDLGVKFGDTTYIGEVGDEGGAFLRENKYGLGDPGKTENSALEKIIGMDPFKKKKGYDVFSPFTISALDKINMVPVLAIPENIPNSFLGKAAKDFVPFRFNIIDQENGNTPKYIVFRAFLDSISDDFSATHNSYKYNGRGEEFYTYNKFNRKIQISFKIAAQTRFAMKPIYQKLNFLAAQTAPNYSAQGRIRTPYCKMTVGDWFNKIPGLITNVGLTWQKDYPWEIALDKEIDSSSGAISGKDKDMLILPHVLDVSLSFQPIHKFTPNNNEKTPFIGIDGGNRSWMESATQVNAVEGDTGPETGVVVGSYKQQIIRPADSTNLDQTLEY